MNRFRSVFCFVLYSLAATFSFIIADNSNAQAQLWKKVIPFSESPKKEDGAVDLPIPQEQLQLFIKEDCKNLSSLQMNNRPMGSKAAEQAGMYIGKTMNGFGISPYARNFVHTFWFVSGKDFTPETRFTIGKNYVFIPEEAFPAPYSATGEIRNYILPDSREIGQPWIIPLYQSQQEANEPDFDWISATYKRAQQAVERGATAVIFYDSYDSKYAPKYTRNSSLPELGIPVVILHYKAYTEKIKDISVLTPFYLNIKFKNEHDKAANIVGYIDNRAAQNVIICAHYDGASANVLENENNTSGIAAMMSVARLLVKTNAKKYNYILVAFSGGAATQLGADALLQDKSFDKTKVAYVINLDNVGKMSSSNELYVNGITSSVDWLPFFKKQTNGIQCRFEHKEIATSDNVSFLKQEIPALSFTTYVADSLSDAKSNMPHLISTTAITRVVSLVYRLIVTMNGQDQPTFANGAQKDRIEAELARINAPKPVGRQNTAIATTPAPILSKNRTFKTSVGIVCDSSYNGFGVKVLNILKQQPADRAGLQEGDIIMQMGAQKINTLSDYTAAINKLKGGEKLVIKVKRGVTVQSFTLVNL